MIIVAILGGAFAGAGAYIIAKHLLGKVRNLPDWLIYLTNGVPWASPRSLTALGAEHGLQPLYWVSRHDIAECGLVCPRCAALAAEQGDLTNVRRMLINGRENEVVKCLNSIEGEDGSKRACNAILVASPDTEHGDDTTAGDPDDFYRFCRTTAARVLRDRYGMDASGVDIDGNVTIGPRPPPPGPVIDAATGKPAVWHHSDGAPIAATTVAAIKTGMADSAAGRVTERDFSAHADEPLDNANPKES